MKCPYCGEKIDSTSINCPVCGEKITYLKKLQTLIKENLLFYLKRIVILLLATIVCCVGYIIINNEIYSPYYKSVISYELLTKDNKPTTGAAIINLLNQQEIDLMILLKSKAFQTRKNAVFSTYYNNLRHYSELLEEKQTTYNYNAENTLSQWNSRLSTGKNDILNGITYQPIIKKNEYGNNLLSGIQIINPKANYYTFVYYGEGYFKPIINIQEIVDKYALYLSQDWKEYFNNRLIEDKILSGNSFFIECYLNVDKKYLADWTIMWQNFLKKYPKYELNNEINKSLKLYSVQFIHFNDIDWDTESITIEERKKYEYYLNKVDITSEQYKMVKEVYESYKNRNWKEQKNIYNVSDEDAWVGGEKVNMGTQC